MTDPQYTSIRSCAAPGCQKPRRYRGSLCNTHDWRMRQYGTFDLPDDPEDAKQRFEAAREEARAAVVRKNADECRLRLWTIVPPHLPTDAAEYLARFLASVRVSERGCWMWQGTHSTQGYGRFRINGGEYQAHRVAYEWWVGPIAEGLVLDHLCRNRECANPYHVEPVTEQINILRGEAPGSQAHRRQSCHRGHPYTEENTYYFRGYAQCRICKRLARQRRERRAA